MAKANDIIKCYMCKKKATSKEHVPPLCLFPEQKDIKTEDFRINLIKVPSCDKHNLNKSSDDEFLMASLTGLLGLNEIGQKHRQTKVSRTYKRHGQKLEKQVFLESRLFIPKNLDEKTTPLIIGKADGIRLVKCFEHIAYGLYYHKFSKRFKGEIKCIIDFLVYEDERMDKYKQILRAKVKNEKYRPKEQGNNPKVFTYEFYEPDEFGLVALMLDFYEGAKVYICFKDKKSKEPFNLGLKLADSGIKTTVKFEDGKEIKFNH